MKHTAKEWFETTRYWSFTVSAMPVIVTFAYLCNTHRIVWGPVPIINFILATIGIVVLHAAGNLLSDYFDHKEGVDNPEAYAVPQLVSGKFQPQEYLRFSAALFVLGCTIGIVLVFLSGWQLLIIGGIGAVLAMLYSQFKFKALGDLYVFTMFGVLPPIGTSYVICGYVVWQALVLAIPMGIITVSVLHANNTTDIESDRKAGIKTLAMILGGSKASKLYIAYMLIPFIYMIVVVALQLCGAVGLHWSALLCLLAFPQALGNLKRAAEYPAKGLSALAGLDFASSQLHLKFSLLLTAALAASAFIG